MRSPHPGVMLAFVLVLFFAFKACTVVGLAYEKYGQVVPPKNETASHLAHLAAEECEWRGGSLKIQIQCVIDELEEYLAEGAQKPVD
jgi:Zn-dependent membrane protease YugP